MLETMCSQLSSPNEIEESCWVYLPLVCSTERYVGEGNNNIADLQVNSRSHRDIEVSLIGNSKEIHMIRARIKGVNKPEGISETENKTISHIFDHMLSVLSICYDREVQALDFGSGRMNLSTFTLLPSLNTVISKHISEEFSVNSQNIVDAFCSSWKHRSIMRLTADAQNPRVPIQYRYLSIYKVFEILYKNKKKWSQEFLDIIKAHENLYLSLNVSKMTLKSFIHAMRDKCAHTYLTESDQGIIGVTSEDVGVLHAVFPVVSDMLKTALRKELAASGMSFA